MTANIADVATKTFDYVIVGAGAAGLVLAAELSKNPKVSVLVLEAGLANIDDPVLQRPASYGAQFGNKIYAWDHHTVEQQHSNKRTYAWARGKGLGGSTCINFMAYTKPTAEDIDDWERIGNTGWNWESLQDALARLEGFTPPSIEVQEKFHIHPEGWDIGSEGPLRISFPGYINDEELLVQETFARSGIPRAPQPFNGDPRGYFFSPNTYDSRTHARSYATTAFYMPNKKRPNLSVLVLAHVHNVVTERDQDGQLRATGVRFEHDEKMYVAKARLEVILSAGTCKTPQLLELSGIGRRDVIERIGVPLALELPGVGENVQEHVVIGISWELKDDAEYQTLDLLRDPAFAKEQMELYRQGKGLFTIGVTNFAFGTLEMFSSKAGEIYKDIQDMIASVHPESAPLGLLEQYEIQAERFKPGSGSPSCGLFCSPFFFSAPNKPTPGKRYISMMTGINNQLSRGTVHCASADPNADPDYDPHYFEQKCDLDVFVEAVKFVRNLGRISPLSDMIAREVNPGLEVQEDDDLRNWIKSYMSTTWHTASACSMLPKEKGGVVDTSLKVYGTSNLRVVDLSVAPLHFSSHTQSITYAIAAKASDIIKKERVQ